MCQWLAISSNCWEKNIGEREFFKKGKTRKNYKLVSSTGNWMNQNIGQFNMHLSIKLGISLLTIQSSVTASNYLLKLLQDGLSNITLLFKQLIQSHSWNMSSNHLQHTTKCIIRIASRIKGERNQKTRKFTA